MLSTGLYDSIKKYIWDHLEDAIVEDCNSSCVASEEPLPKEAQSLKYRGLVEYVKVPEETWQEMLLRLLLEKKMSNADCYKAAEVDRRLFSAIQKNRKHKPQKNTAIRFALGLRLPMNEAEEMLKKAGYALSHSDVKDLIIEYFILNRRYNVGEVNEALSAFNQELL